MSLFFKISVFGVFGMFDFIMVAGNSCLYPSFALVVFVLYWVWLPGDYGFPGWMYMGCEMLFFSTVFFVVECVWSFGFIEIQPAGGGGWDWL